MVSMGASGVSAAHRRSMEVAVRYAGSSLRRGFVSGSSMAMPPLHSRSGAVVHAPDSPGSTRPQPAAPTGVGQVDGSPLTRQRPNGPVRCRTTIGASPRKVVR